jgi:hypothetical protein
MLAAKPQPYSVEILDNQKDYDNIITKQSPYSPLGHTSKISQKNIELMNSISQPTE